MSDNAIKIRSFEDEIDDAIFQVIKEQVENNPDYLRLGVSVLSSSVPLLMLIQTLRYSLREKWTEMQGLNIDFNSKAAAEGAKAQKESIMADFGIAFAAGIVGVLTAGITAGLAIKGNSMTKDLTAKASNIDAGLKDLGKTQQNIIDRGQANVNVGAAPVPAPHTPVGRRMEELKNEKWNGPRDIATKRAAAFLEHNDRPAFIRMRDNLNTKIGGDQRESNSLWTQVQSMQIRYNQTYTQIASTAGNVVTQGATAGCNVFKANETQKAGLFQSAKDMANQTAESQGRAGEQEASAAQDADKQRRELAQLAAR